MKQKLTIAIAAILTSSLLLAGCAAWTAPTETTADDTLSYGAYSAREDAVAVGSGYRGRSETAGSNYAADNYVVNDTVEDSYNGYGGYGAPEGPAIQGNIMLIGADGAESDALKLNYSVKGLFGRQVLYTARQNGTVLTLDVPASVATFRCTMEDLTTMMNNGINTLVFKTEKTSTTLNLSLLTEGYDADAKVKLHQCGSTVRLSVNGRGRRDLLIGR